MRFNKKLKTKIMLFAMCFSTVVGSINVSAITPTELICELAKIYKIEIESDGTAKSSACATDKLTDKELKRLDKLSDIAVEFGIDKIVYDGHSVRDYAESLGCVYFFASIIAKDQKSKKLSDDKTRTEPTGFTQFSTPITRKPLGKILISSYAEVYSLQIACGLEFHNRVAIDCSSKAPTLTTEQKKSLKKIVDNAFFKRKINSEYCNGNTLLHYAAMYNCPYLINLLKDAGANMNIVGHNWQGNTPLHTASYYGNKDAIATLIHCGARVDIPNKHGNIPLIIIEHGCHSKCDIAKLLIPHNYEDSQFVNNKGETPLSIAKKYRRTSIISLLEKPTKKTEAPSDSKEGAEESPLPEIPLTLENTKDTAKEISPKKAEISGTKKVLRARTDVASHEPEKKRTKVENPYYTFPPICSIIPRKLLDVEESHDLMVRGLQTACGLRFINGETISNWGTEAALTSEQKATLIRLVNAAKHNNMINAPYVNGHTLLYYATVFNCPYFIQLLYDAGANLEPDGAKTPKTPFMSLQELAAKHNSLDVLNLLSQLEYKPQ